MIEGRLSSRTSASPPCRLVCSASLGLLGSEAQASGRLIAADLDGSIAGTLPYMSPEHFGAGAYSVSSDIYSFGVVMYEALTGRPPFQCASAEEYRRAHSEWVAPALTRRTVPEQVATVIFTCLAKDPARRFQDFASLEHALASAQGGPRGSAGDVAHPVLAELEASLTSSDWNIRGYSLARLGMPDESLICYQRALSLEEDAGNHANLGTALDRVGRHDEALTHLELARTMEPDQHLFGRSLASAYAKRERWEDALAELQPLLQNPQAHEPSLFGDLGVLYARTGRAEDAEELVTPLVALLRDQPTSAYVQLGIQLGLAGAPKLSLAVLEAAVSLFPSDALVWHNRSVTLLGLGRRETALESSLTCVRLAPTLPPGWFLLGLICLLMGAFEEAQRVWSTLWKWPDHYHSRIVAAFLSLLAQDDDGEQAMSWLQKELRVPQDLYYS